MLHVIKKYIPISIAIKGSIFLYSLFLIAHVIILLTLILGDTYFLQYIWGGQITTHTHLLVFASFSFIVLSCCLFLVLIRGGFIRQTQLYRLSHRLMRGVVLLFSLNTLGNLAAETYLEKSLAVVTLILTVFAWRLTMKE